MLHTHVLVTGGVVSILNAHEVTTLLDVVGATEQDIDLLEHDVPGLWDEEIDESGKQEVDAGEHVERVEAAVVQESREELLHDGVGDVLGLRSHADGLRAHVHGEDFGGPDPDCCTPRWLVCENDQYTCVARGGEEGEDLQKKANRKSKKTMLMPTGSLFAPPLSVGVSVSTAATMIMQIPIPMAPMMSRNLRPKRSTVQVAFIVKRILKVALRALMSAMVLALVKTFLYTMVE